MNPTVRYFLFIDGEFKGVFSSLKRAKEGRYCGDVFRIYEAKVIFEEDTRLYCVSGGLCSTRAGCNCVNCKKYNEVPHD